ncbi:hypothetical protein KIL84_015144 [Mauremys mutica]|uniref:Uncharacterized protein n=1 Tax=Mauremys mutica TaxID=74926 RepID=A0A9D4ALZ7_9SAUR|nr:hypothetical protein KIL84_015144 [Mauremys mutica]
MINRPHQNHNYCRIRHTVRETRMLFFHSSRHVMYRITHKRVCGYWEITTPFKYRVKHKTRKSSYSNTPEGLSKTTPRALAVTVERAAGSAVEYTQVYKSDFSLPIILKATLICVNCQW